MKLKIAVFAVAVVALLLIAGCSKQTPITEPAAMPVPQVTTPAPTPAPAVVQEAMQKEPETPPEFAQADETAQDLDTSSLDQIDRDIDALAVP